MSAPTAALIWGPEGLNEAQRALAEVDERAAGARPARMGSGPGSGDHTQGETIMGNHIPDLADAPGSTPFVHDVDGAPANWRLGVRREVLIDAADTGGRWSLTHETLPEGAGAPPHEHAGSDERFHVLEGEITFVVGDEITVARGGDLVFVPRGARHAFRVDSETATFLNGHTPAGA